MVTDLSRRVAENYSSGARDYEEIWGPVLIPLGSALVDALPIDNASRILDAGTGVGGLLAVLRKRAPRARVVGVDLAHEMLKRVRQDTGLACMNLDRLAFRDGSFDAVVSTFVLFHLSDPRRSLAEFYRVLRSGGVLGTATWDKEPEFLAQRVWIEELDRHGARPALKTTDHSLFDSESKLADCLESGNFTVEWTRKCLLEHTHEPDLFLRLRTGLGGSRGRFLSLPQSKREALLARVRSRFDELDEDAFVERSYAIFACARRA